MAKRDKGGGTRKYDRNRAWCQVYRNRQQRERNKAKRLVRHLRRFPDDKSARRCYNNLPAEVKPAGHRAVV